MAATNPRRTIFATSPRVLPAVRPNDRSAEMAVTGWLLLRPRQAPGGARSWLLGWWWPGGPRGAARPPSAGYDPAIPSRMALAAALRAVSGSVPPTIAASAIPNGLQTCPIAGMAGRMVPSLPASANLGMFGSSAVAAVADSVSAGRRGSTAYRPDWNSGVGTTLVRNSWASVLFLPLLAR